MRNISTDFKAHLKTGATTVCRCWKIVRKDGTEFGFSDHDNDLQFEGTVFEAGSGLDATALQSANGLSVDNTEAAGALSSAGITENDIAAGKFDGAEVFIWLVNWQNSDQRYLSFRGYIGEISYGRSAFTAELRGVTDKLNTRIGRSYLKQCTALLGDEACRADLSSENFEIKTSLRRCEDQLTLYFDDIPNADTDWFTFGTVTFTSGMNQGKSVRVVSDKSVNSERKISVMEELFHPVLQGDEVTLKVGCDKQSSTCQAKFQNMINYQGFPSIPGEDWMMAYPKSDSDY
jgi:uncharacterized phage protein (TIGR02218 family)